ncbi:hypothetical protein PybrP1_007094 [[Pythium] brassicae (nom. inval.)]|nr:hypothetical protein PybrP1_007094 [[Pythium] brassicae (nom. inval.)]
MAPVKRALSSYMIFCNDRRKEVADANPGLRIGEIQKLISVQWKALSEQEREHYVQLAAKDKERYAQEVAANPAAAADAEDDGEDAPAPSSACVYQLGRVRKVVQTDPDAGRINRDALIAIAKATELFVQFLGTKGYENALFENRRQIKASDITRSIQSIGALDWLREDFPDVKPASASQAKATAAKDKAGAAAAKALPSGLDFFKPHHAAAAKRADASEQDDDAAAVDEE